MSDAPDDRPRSWIPLAAAAAVGVLVLVGAIAAFALGGGPGETDAAVIAACEADQAEAGGPAIIAGEIYDPTEWRDHYGVVETHGAAVTPLDELPPEEVERWEARAEAFTQSGEGSMVIVWRLEDDSYAQCAVPVVDGSVDADAASVGPLGVVPASVDG